MLQIALKSAADRFLALKYRRRRLPIFDKYQPVICGKYGIEVGGPSALFKTILPLYQSVGDLDGVNFAADTVWEGGIAAGYNYNYYSTRHGRQFIADATDLNAISSSRYDFLLSSNCLEHVANPIKALHEWKRVLKPDGWLILVLPNKARNFDHRRPFTKFEHILEDFDRRMGEDDLTHLDEILALHDLAMDPPAGNPDQFRARSLNNFQNRTLHHHVFDVELISKMLNYVGFDTVDLTTTHTDFFSLAIKSEDRYGATLSE